MRTVSPSYLLDADGKISRPELIMKSLIPVVVSCSITPTMSLTIAADVWEYASSNPLRWLWLMRST